WIERWRMRDNMARLRFAMRVDQDGPISISGWVRAVNRASNLFLRAYARRCTFRAQESCRTPIVGSVRRFVNPNDEGRTLCEDFGKRAAHHEQAAKVPRIAPIRT